MGKATFLRFSTEKARFSPMFDGTRLRRRICCYLKNWTLGDFIGIRGPLFLDKDRRGYGSCQRISTGIQGTPSIA